MRKVLTVLLAAFLVVALLPQPAVADHCRQVLLFAVCTGPDHDEESESSPEPTGDTSSPPASITANCSRDVTDQLQAWIDSQPDGDTWDFTDRCYRIDGQLRLVDRHGLTLVGGTFRAEGTGEEWLNETGSSRTQWWLERTSHITFAGMTVEGTNFEGQHYNQGPPKAAFQHNWAVKSTAANITFEGVVGRYAWGDWIAFCDPNLDTQPYTDLAVRDSTFVAGGRQGISLCYGERVTIERNHFGDGINNVLDVEVSPRDGWYARDVTFKDNTIRGHRFYVVTAGSSRPATDVLIEGNTMEQVGDTCRAPLRSSGGADARWTVRGNTFIAHGDAVELVDGTDHLVENNELRTYRSACGSDVYYGLDGTGSSGVYRDNVLYGFDRLGTGLAGWEVSGNRME